MLDSTFIPFIKLLSLFVLARMKAYIDLRCRATQTGDGGLEARFDSRGCAMTAPVFSGQSESTGEFVGAPFGTEIEYRAALREAMRAEMHRDPGVILIGEEVARYGGAYAVSKGMLEEFGEARIIDTPISEPAIVGSAVGAAMTGLKPIAELMYVDFGYLAMDQIANQAAKIRYMS